MGRASALALCPGWAMLRLDLYYAGCAVERCIAVHMEAPHPRDWPDARRAEDGAGCAAVPSDVRALFVSGVDSGYLSVSRVSVVLGEQNAGVPPSAARSRLSASGGG